MQGRSRYDVVVYCLAILALATATWVVLFFLIHVVILALNLTENPWLSDMLAEFVVRTKGFARIVAQILVIAVVYFVGHSLWRLVHKV